MAASDPTRLARDALERVCSGSDPSAAVGVYSADFRDHVNARDYHGHEGIRRSLGLYQLVFTDGDLRIRVRDQVSEGDRVASRWVAEGHNRGRLIRIWGIVISRIEDGEIVEDWAASDTLEVIRQLGPWRTLLLGIASLRKAATRSSTR
jgi:predicted ester cyclase